MLRDFVIKPDVVAESSERFTERGVTIGARAVPAEAPVKVVLSTPYLTSRDGLTSDGRQLLQFPGDYSVRIHHFETDTTEVESGHGFLTGHYDRQYLGNDWRALLDGEEQYRIRNLVTNESFVESIPKWIHNGTQIGSRAPIFMCWTALR